MSVGMLGSGLAQIAHAKEMIELVVPRGCTHYIILTSLVSGKYWV